MNVTVAVTIAQGGDTLTVNTTDASAAFLGDIPSAVHDMTAQWQQANGREHPTPGKLTLELILDTATHAAIGYESEVNVQVSLAGRDPVPMWRGWIDEVTVTRRTVHHPDTRRPVTTWAWSLLVGDVIARAAATKINMAPLPRETAFNTLLNPENKHRIEKIEDATPIPLISPQLKRGLVISFPASRRETTKWCRARDVDNQPVLDLLQDIANMGPLQVHENYDGLTMRHPMPGTRSLTWVTLIDRSEFMGSLWYGGNRFGNGSAEVGPGGGSLEGILGTDPRIESLPASAVVETPRKINRASMLNEVSIGYYVVANTNNTDSEPEERTHYVRNTTRQASTSQQRLASDRCLVYYPNVESEPPLTGSQVDTANAWVSLAGTPSRSIESVEVITDHPDVTVEQIEPYLMMGERAVRAVVLTDPPDDLDVAWRVLGGTATIRQGELALTLTVESARLAGQETITWDDIPRPAVGTFENGEQALVVPTFNRMPTRVTYAATALVANHTLYWSERTSDG